MPATFNVPDHIRDVLRAATVYIPDKPSPANPYTLKLNGQLDHKVYQDTMKVIDGAGGKWDRKRALHTFTSDPSHLLMLAVEEGKGRNVQQEFQAFYTPAPLAEKMVGLLGIPKGYTGTVLEPSFGEGALIDAIRDTRICLGIHGCDIDIHAADAIMKRHGLGCRIVLHQQDFLKINPDFYDRYQYVIMNPPFTKGQDAKHVMHAMQFLTKGGTLVALMTPNAMEKATGPYKTFNAALQANAATLGGGFTLTYSEKIPAKTFKDTPIETLLLRIERIE